MDYKALHEVHGDEVTLSPSVTIGGVTFQLTYTKTDERSANRILAHALTTARKVWLLTEPRQPKDGEWVTVTFNLNDLDEDGAHQGTARLTQGDPIRFTFRDGHAYVLSGENGYPTMHPATPPKGRAR